MFTLVLAVAVSGCGGGGSGGAGGAGNPPPPPPPPSAIAPELTQQPTAASVSDGGSATFSVTAGGTAPFSYQWQRNGQDIAGATSATLTVDHAALPDSGAQYRVVVTNSAGSVTSASAVLTVNPIPVAIDLQPVPVGAQEGATASLQVHATGSGPLRYQWFRAGQPIVGATDTVLTVGPLHFGDDVDYTVQVSNDGSTAASSAAAIYIAAAAPVRPLSDCGEITAPGSYLLTSSIVPAGRIGACVYVHDTHDVQIDCATHKLASSEAINIERVDHFSLRNCIIDAGYFHLTQTSWGSITGNSLSSSWADFPQMVVTAFNAGHIVFAHNTIYGAYQEMYSDSGTASNNRIFGSPRISGAAGIVSDFSKHARIAGNTIDGGWPGHLGNTMGSDDGIVISDASDAIIENNTISNVWDTGIEWAGTISDSIIRDNNVKNAPVSAIGGWYYTSISNVQFLRNTAAADVGRLFLIYRYDGLRPAGSDGQGYLPADTEVRFRDNVFDGNVQANPQASNISLFNKMGYTGSVSGQPGERVIPDDAFNIGNNVFRNNDFGAGLPPDFGNGPVVPGWVIDGGGNKCVNGWPASYPLKCI